MMREREDLEKYIGKEYNKEIKKQIETRFNPYTVEICSLDCFYCENYWENQIRCVLVEGKIAYISFN